MFTTDMSRHLAGRFVALSAGESLTVGESEFGSGESFLRAWHLFGQFAPPTASLDFFSVVSRVGDLVLSGAIWCYLRRISAICRAISVGLAATCAGLESLGVSGRASPVDAGVG